MSFATFLYSSAIRSAQRPTHSLQILTPSVVISLKTWLLSFPQNEQFPLDIGWLLDTPKREGGHQSMTLQCASHDDMLFRWEGATIAPIPNGRLRTSGYFGNCLKAAKSVDYIANRPEFCVSHAPSYLTKREVVKPQEKEIGNCANLNRVGSMNERRESGGKEGPSAKRFRAIMAATSRPHENATQWAYRMGLGPTAVSNFRNGIPVSARAADLIAERTGIGSDYIRRGDDRFLTIEMRDKIQEAIKSLEGDDNEPPSLPREGHHVRS